MNATYVFEKGVSRLSSHAYEEDLARRWWLLPLHVTLPLTNGQDCQLIHAGRPGGTPGPDIRDAILSFSAHSSQAGVDAAHSSRAYTTGDVEIHIRATDWFAHRHHTDKRYNNVVLHIVLICDNSQPTRTDILICNIILPFALAVAERENCPALSECARNLYLNYPGLSSNQIKRAMRKQLLLKSEPRGACQQQGLHFIYAQTCREKRCQACLIVKQGA